MLTEIGIARWRLSGAVSYRLRAIRNGRYAKYCRPASIVLMLTDLCNARCTHCDIWKNKDGKEVPSLDEWNRLLTDLRQWLGPAQVTLSGGEALLRRDAHAILAHGSQVGLFMELLSHGYWRDQKRIEQVARANPWRVTVSVDGIGETHNLVRGKADFWDRTSDSLDTLLRLRRDEKLRYDIQLKTVLMRQNLEAAADVAHYAADKGVGVVYQAIAQNYNTEEDPLWYETSPNWPRDTDKAMQAVDQLLKLKERGLPIRNRQSQLEAMKSYFRDPDGLRVAILSHTSHEARAQCPGMTNLQIQANGDVLTCSRVAPCGNFRQTPIRELWAARPQYWLTGCCRERSPDCAEAEMSPLKIAK
ncbi:MAG TPA: radical SAM protein [Candidatus Sulfotelmatobacter sp.]|nr:radical SAM protein [Candidatus Sulfotelmatobacter sp.]